MTTTTTARRWLSVRLESNLTGTWRIGGNGDDGKTHTREPNRTQCLKQAVKLNAGVAAEMRDVTSPSSVGHMFGS